MNVNDVKKIWKIIEKKEKFCFLITAGFKFYFIHIGVFDM